ncbi:MAG: excinuclease ABC subunit UvrA, partial [Puniceicoccales bacterium]
MSSTRRKSSGAPRKKSARGASRTQSPESIRLRGVRQNNLKGFDLDLPLGQLIVVTGLSGAGKSSLVFETLHAEGQRRYVETFSPYTRQFLEMMDRPKVDRIENIRPFIAIEQSNTVKTSRSTVGTMTELCDYFKVWFSHESHLHDPATGKRIYDDNPQSIWKTVHAEHPDAEALVCFAVTKPEKLKWKDILGPISAQGYTRLLVNGSVTRLDDFDAEKSKVDSFFVIVDRVILSDANRTRFIEATTQALHFGQGEITLALSDEVKSRKSKDKSGGKSQLASKQKSLDFILSTFSSGLRSPETGQTFKPATPGMFSFNSPLGACPKCRGFGRVIEIDYGLVIPDQTLSLNDGAIKPFQGQVYSESLRDLAKAGKKIGLPMNTPWRELTNEQRDFVLEGDPNYGVDGNDWPKAWYGVRRFFEWLESNTYKMHVRVFLSKFRSYGTCPDCHGTRLQPNALNWKWQGHTLPDLYRMPVGELHSLMAKHVRATGNHQADLAAQAIQTRLDYLVRVGLDYLTLDRTSRTLSGGEVERVNLTACLGTSLTDTLFVLDEPSIGLHARDIGRLIEILRSLTNQGNTVVVVEHDEAIMRAADTILEIG